MDAHRLFWLADQQNYQDAVVEAVFRAYFTEGRDFTNRQTLIDVVAEAGLDRKRAEAMLTSEEGMDAIKEAEELSRRHHVSGVPFFSSSTMKSLCLAYQQPDAFLAVFGKAVGGK